MAEFAVCRVNFLIKKYNPGLFSGTAGCRHSYLPCCLQVYVSYDHGTTFIPVSHKFKFSGAKMKDGSKQVISQFYHSPADNRRVSLVPLTRIYTRDKWKVSCMYSTQHTLWCQLYTVNKAFGCIMGNLRSNGRIVETNPASPPAHISVSVDLSLVVFWWSWTVLLSRAEKLSKHPNIWTEKVQF